MDEIIRVTFKTQEMLRGRTCFLSTLYSHLVLRKDNTITGFGVWTDKVPHNNTFYTTDINKTNITFTEKKLSLLNRVPQKHYTSYEIRGSRNGVDGDSNLLVKRQRVTDNLRQCIATIFGDQHPKNSQNTIKLFSNIQICWDVTPCRLGYRCLHVINASITAMQSHSCISTISNLLQLLNMHHYNILM
jgi:hypothetical protein